MMSDYLFFGIKRETSPFDRNQRRLPLFFIFPSLIDKIIRSSFTSSIPNAHLSLIEMYDDRQPRVYSQNLDFFLFFSYH
jgi:hypothetical protein